MGKLIKVKVIETFDEIEIFINPEHIVYIAPMKDTFLMVLTGDKRYPLAESIDELLAKLN